MRLVTTYTPDGSHSFGALTGDMVLDLARAWAACPSSVLGATSVADFPTDIVAFLQGSAELWEVATHLIRWGQSLGDQALPMGIMQSLSALSLAPPIPNPSKIICIGLNYMDHCREQNLEIPEHPIVFAKFPSALIGPDDPITWPPHTSDQVDYEAELAVVIRQRAYRIPPNRAYEFIAGYTILNDVSARDAQFADQQWVRSKSFDTFAPLGPSLVTLDEIENPHELGIRCWLNGRLVQDSNTSEMIFSIPQLVSYISETCTLLPGDIISTGTPDGVGVFRQPAVFLKPGDVVEVEVDRIGRLRNPVSHDRS